MDCITGATITATGAAVAGVITAIAGWVRARAEKQRANADRALKEAFAKAVAEKLGLRDKIFDRCWATYVPATIARSTGQASTTGAFTMKDAQMLDETDEQLVNRWLKGEIA